MLCACTFLLAGCNKSSEEVIEEDTIVKPINILETLKFLAILDAPSTKKSAP